MDKIKEVVLRVFYCSDEPIDTDIILEKLSELNDLFSKASESKSKIILGNRPKSSSSSYTVKKLSKKTKSSHSTSTKKTRSN